MALGSIGSEKGSKGNNSQKLQRPHQAPRCLLSALIPTLGRKRWRKRSQRVKDSNWDTSSSNEMKEIWRTTWKTSAFSTYHNSGRPQKKILPQKRMRFNNITGILFSILGPVNIKSIHNGIKQNDVQALKKGMKERCWSIYIQEHSISDGHNVSVYNFSLRSTDKMPWYIQPETHIRNMWGYSS
jgi:hypothetical protein